MMWVAVLFQTILGGLITIAPTLIGRMLLALGIGTITYTGIQASLDGLRDLFVSQLSLLDAETVNVLAYMKVGSAVSVVMSAITVRLVLNGLTSDTVKRWVTR